MIEAISTALSGLNNASQRVNESAKNIARAGTLDPIDRVNISEEAVNLQLAEAAYKANIAVIQTETELTEDLLRILDDQE